MDPIGHFRTITRHRHLVMRYCFRLGLYRQGLAHDLSKYSPSEFLPGCRYYLGYRSPNDAERQENGYSLAWLHHKGRNKHHPEYWTDFSPDPNEKILAVEMPKKYVAEMFCDRVAACKIYHGAKYRDSDPYDYFVRSLPRILIHPATAELLRRMLTVLKDQGEEAAFRYIKEDVL
ncbi:MAG: DUF5662 family protein [Oscillospiraceae bacterium]